MLHSHTRCSPHADGGEAPESSLQNDGPNSVPTAATVAEIRILWQRPPREAPTSTTGADSVFVTGMGAGEKAGVVERRRSLARLPVLSVTRLANQIGM